MPVALPYLPAPRVPTVYRQAPVRPVADASGAPVLRDQGPIGRPGTADTGVSGTAGYLSVWSSISALGALRLTDSMPLIALVLPS